MLQSLSYCKPLSTKRISASLNYLPKNLAKKDKFSCYHEVNQVRIRTKSRCRLISGCFTLFKNISFDYSVIMFFCFFFKLGCSFHSYIESCSLMSSSSFVKYSKTYSYELMIIKYDYRRTDLDSYLF